MKTETTGTVMSGVLKLDEQLTLPDHSRVRVAIEPLEDSKMRFNEGWKAWMQLYEEHPIHSVGLRSTRDEFHERH